MKVDAQALNHRRFWDAMGRLTRAPIAQRGKAKQKRVDLRLVGLALVVTRDGGIPIVSHAYPGDRPDVTQFCTVLDELVGRYRLLVA